MIASEYSMGSGNLVNDSYLVVSAAKDPAHELALTESFRRPDLVLTGNSISYPMEGYGGRELALNNFTGRNVNYPIREKDFVDNVLSGHYSDSEGYVRDEDFPEARNGFLSELSARVREESDGRSILANTYSNRFGHAFLKDVGAIVVGPSSELVNEYESKAKSYILASSLGVPVVDGGVTDNLKDANELYNKLRNKYPAVFMSSALGLGGGEETLKLSGRNVEGFSGGAPYIMTGWIDKLGSPSSQMLIGKDQVIYLGMGDQIIEDGVKYGGNLFPSILPEDVQDKIRSNSLKIAESMRDSGYRGFTGMDFMVDRKGEVYFSEINPRKTRQTSVFVGHLNSYKPSDHPSFTELEILASLNQPWGKLSPVDEWVPKNEMHWGTKVYSVDGGILINKDINPDYTDNSIFADFPSDGRSTVLNFPGNGSFLPDFGKDYSLVRIVATGSNRDEVLSGLEREVSRIEGAYSIANRG